MPSARPSYFFCQRTHIIYRPLKPPDVKAGKVDFKSIKLASQGPPPHGRDEEVLEELTGGRILEVTL